VSACYLLAPAHLGSPIKRAVKLLCVCLIFIPFWVGGNNEDHSACRKPAPVIPKSFLLEQIEEENLF